jgi:uncharacterized protein
VNNLYRTYFSEQCQSAMKILALTDIHGAYATAERIIRRETPDVIVIGGDMTTAGTVADAGQGLEMFRKHGTPLLCVAGNMDRPDHDELYVRQGVSINARPVIVGSVAFFGVSGAPVSPLRTPYEIPEEEILRRARSGLGAVDRTVAGTLVFVPHAPPHGTTLDVITSGRHVGSTAVRRFIEEEQPHLVLCGHIHEAKGIEKIGSTLAVNCGPAGSGCYATVDISEGVITPALCRLD